MHPISRRAALQIAAGTAAMAVAGVPAQAAPDDAAKAIELFSRGGRTAEPGGITLDLADSVEDGNSVPLSVSVDSPMRPDDYVTEVRVLAERNPWVGVGTFNFTPLAGRAAFSTRIRLTEGQAVIVMARTSNDVIHVTRKHVNVTVGACSN
jgi:sulfur-oxidizing protein SoxY